MIYDCILYNGEKSLLDIRLNETRLADDWVTTVIVEANKTHTGWDKPLYFEQHKDEFKNFNIFYFVVEFPELSATPREREAYQRNQIKRALEFLEPQPNDTIIVSDVDEVPRARQIKLFKHQIGFAALMMDKYAYYLNNLEEFQIWQRAKIMSWEYLKNKEVEKVRNSGYDFCISHAGWHWSWCEDPIRKLQSFSHTELDTPENIERVEKKENVWNDAKFKRIDIDLSHPEYLYKNQERFKSLILP